MHAKLDKKMQRSTQFRAASFTGLQNLHREQRKTLK